MSAMNQVMKGLGAVFRPINNWAENCIANHQQEKIVFASLGLWTVIIGGAMLKPSKKPEQKPAAASH
jgi:hypothetical protein